MIQRQVLLEQFQKILLNFDDPFLRDGGFAHYIFGEHKTMHIFCGVYGFLPATVMAAGQESILSFLENCHCLSDLEYE